MTAWRSAETLLNSTPPSSVADLSLTTDLRTLVVPILRSKGILHMCAGIESVQNIAVVHDTTDQPCQCQRRCRFQSCGVHTYRIKLRRRARVDFRTRIIGLHHRQRCQSSSRPPPPASTDLRAGIHGFRHASWCLTPADTSFASHPIACLTQALLGSWHMGSNKQPSFPEHSASPATSHTLHTAVRASTYQSAARRLQDYQSTVPTRVFPRLLTFQHSRAK